MAVCEWLRIQESDFSRDGNFKLYMDKRQFLWIVLKTNGTSVEHRSYSYCNHLTFYVYDVENLNYEYGRITV